MTSSLSTQEIFERARAASRQSAEVPLAQRHDRLARLQRLLDENEAALAAAVDADFGGRGARLTEIADLFLLRGMLGDLRRHLGRWSRPRRARCRASSRTASTTGGEARSGGGCRRAA